MTVTTEIAQNLFRISVYSPDKNLEFNHFLTRDEEPLLFHAGYRAMFPEIYEHVAKLIEVSKLRYIGFSHFEGDECGALNDWLAVAPRAQPLCGQVGAQVNINDFAIRPAKVMQPGDIVRTGRFKFRFVPTPHVPHGWDAGLLFEESSRTLFCSDLFHQYGQNKPIDADDIIERSREGLSRMEQGPMAGYMPYTNHTKDIIEKLARCNPETLAIMHGSSFSGNGAKALRDLSVVMRDILRNDV